MRRVAIVGSRGLDYSSDILRCLERMYIEYGDDLVVVTGCARSGADLFARAYAHDFDLVCVVCAAPWGGNWGKAAGPRRNKVIAQLADECHAFWDGKSRGTQNTIREFEALGKPVRIYNGDTQEAEA